MSPVGLTLHMTATNPRAINIDDTFSELFNSNSLSNISEMTSWRKYSITDGVFNTVAQQLSDGVTDNVRPSRLSKSLVDNFLDMDGAPIDPVDEEYKDFNGVFKDCDGRLLAMMVHAGCKFKSDSLMNTRAYDETGTEEEQKGKNKDISSSRLNGDGIYRNVTGLRTRPGIDMTYVIGNCETVRVMFRYVEGLPCCAEAVAELGLYNNGVAEKTLKPLRQRAGVTYVTPTADPYFPFQDLPPAAQEIRRERRLELSLQGFRSDGPIRWRVAGTLKGMEGRGRGACLGKDDVLYLNSSPTLRKEGLNHILIGNEGWMGPLKGYLPEGYEFGEDRDYLSPIPPNEVQMDHELNQSPGWLTK